jgi:hypothetical protein
LQAAELIRRVFFAASHLCLATAGVAVSTAILFYGVRPVLLTIFSRAVVADPVFLLALPFFPLQLAFGFISGYVLASKDGAFGKDGAARYVWIVPTVWFTLFLLTYSSRSIFTESRWEHFIWSTSTSAKKIQCVTTLPFVTSVAYGLGSYTARAVRRSRPTPGS